MEEIEATNAEFFAETKQNIQLKPDAIYKGKHMTIRNSIQSVSHRIACAGALILMAGAISPQAEEHGHRVPPVQATHARTNVFVPQKLPPLPVEG